MTDSGGKPRLADFNLRFNAARSADVALYVTSGTSEVGVDVEEVKPTANVDAIATRFFSPAERRALDAVPSAQRLAACFQCWTHKEAYVKGIGVGLSFPLRTVDVWVGGGDQRAIASGWAVHQVAVAPGFAASVAGENVDEWVPNIPHELKLG